MHGLKIVGAEIKVYTANAFSQPITTRAVLRMQIYHKTYKIV
jgi:hypothetical protein